MENEQAAPGTVVGLIKKLYGGVGHLLLQVQVSV